MHIQSTASTQNRLLPTPSQSLISHLSSVISHISSISTPCCTLLSTLPQLQVNQWTESQPPLNLLPDQPPWGQRAPCSHIIILDCCPRGYLGVYTISASKCIAILALSQHPTSPRYSLQVHQQTPPIMTSKFEQSSPQSASPNSLHLHLLVSSNIPSKCIAQPTWSQHHRVHDDGFEDHLQTSLITSSKFARSGSASSSAHSNDPTLDDCDIVAANGIPQLAQSHPQGWSLHGLPLDAENDWNFVSGCNWMVAWVWPPCLPNQCLHMYLCLHTIMTCTSTWSCHASAFPSWLDHRHRLYHSVPILTIRWWCRATAELNGRGPIGTTAPHYMWQLKAIVAVVDLYWIYSS